MYMYTCVIRYSFCYDDPTIIMFVLQLNFQRYHQPGKITKWMACLRTHHVLFESRHKMLDNSAGQAASENSENVIRNQCFTQFVPQHLTLGMKAYIFDTDASSELNIQVVPKCGAVLNNSISKFWLFKSKGS